MFLKNTKKCDAFRIARVSKELVYLQKFLLINAFVLLNLFCYKTNAAQNVMLNYTDTSANSIQILSNKLSTSAPYGSNSGTNASIHPKSLTITGGGYTIINNDNSLINDGSTTSPPAGETYAAGHGLSLVSDLQNPFSGNVYLYGNNTKLAITNGGALGGGALSIYNADGTSNTTGGLLVLGKGTTLNPMSENDAIRKGWIGWQNTSCPSISAANTIDTANAAANAVLASFYTLPNPIQLGLTGAQLDVINKVSNSAAESSVSVTINLDGATDMVTLSGIISEGSSGSTLVASGNGVLVFAGSSDNTYTGGTTLLGSSTTLMLAGTAPRLIPASGTLKLNNYTILRDSVGTTLVNNTGDTTSTNDPILVSGGLGATIDVYNNSAGTSSLTTTVNKAITGDGTSGQHNILNVTASRNTTGTCKLVLANTSNSTSAQYIDLNIGTKATVSIASKTNIPGGILTLGGTLMSTATSDLTVANASNGLSLTSVKLSRSVTPQFNVGLHSMEISATISDSTTDAGTTASLLTINGTNNTASAGSANNAARLVLGGSNTNSGGISVLTGGLQLKAATAAGSGAIKLAAGTLLEGNKVGGGTYANAITLTNTASSTATILATTDSTFSGLISDSTGASTNALSLIIDGANTSGGTGNTVTFAQTSGVQNSYYGKTTLQGGAGLSISRADHLGNTSAVVMGNKTSINVTTAGFSLPPLIL